MTNMNTKNEKKRLVSLFYFNIMFSGKDMFLVPKYLSDYLNFQGEIVYPKNKENEIFFGEYRGVKLVPIRSLSNYYSTLWSEKEMAWWLIKNAKSIDVLSLFWLNHRNLIFAKLYKLLNPKGICYIKADLGYTDFSKKSVGLKNSIKEWLHKSVDILSVETEENYSGIIEGNWGNHLKKSTVLMSNGFDVELFEETNIVRRNFSEKENLIITVGRIGHIDKNNEIMLASIDGVNIGKWKFMLVGPVEDSFIAVYEGFILRNPDKRGKVILTGAIFDRKQLWEIYNKAKVFLLTSPKEGMPMVFSEALAFGNYIISTKVSSTKDISANGNLGKIIGIGDVDALREALKEVFELKVDLENNYKKAISLSESKFNWRNQITIIGDRIKEIGDSKKN
jgi:GalNAc-alpha-(1->4)-GalNAc-alpha-(1->3)-diNAcBac-PP-undecaprenol alpha-1,4-N-acetyl-D-galactosaminyltransferase